MLTIISTKENVTMLNLKFSYKFSGVAWSFRFATLNKNKMAPIMVSTQHHLDIKAWLIVLDLQQYEGKQTKISFIHSFFEMSEFSFSIR